MRLACNKKKKTYMYNIMYNRDCLNQMFQSQSVDVIATKNDADAVAVAVVVVVVEKIAVVVNFVDELRVDELQ